MKLTDLLRKYPDLMIDDAAEEICTALSYSQCKEDIDLPEYIGDTEDVLKLIDIMENNFQHLAYTDIPALFWLLESLNEVVYQGNEVQDIHKDITIDTLVFEIDNKFYMLEYHSGYYNFPRTNELKEVQKKTKTIEYYE